MQCDTVQWSTIRHSTVQYNTIRGRTGLTSDVCESALLTSMDPAWGGEILRPVTVLDDRLLLIERYADPRPCTERV